MQRHFVILKEEAQQLDGSSPGPTNTNTTPNTIRKGWLEAVCMTRTAVVLSIYLTSIADTMLYLLPFYMGH